MSAIACIRKVSSNPFTLTPSNHIWAALLASHALIYDNFLHIGSNLLVNANPLAEVKEGTTSIDVAVVALDAHRYLLQKPIIS